MLGKIISVTDIYIICRYSDMRKLIDDFCAIIKGRLRLEKYITKFLMLVVTVMTISKDTG